MEEWGEEEWGEEGRGREAPKGFLARWYRQSFTFWGYSFLLTDEHRASRIYEKVFQFQNRIILQILKLCKELWHFFLSFFSSIV